MAKCRKIIRNYATQNKILDKNKLDIIRNELITKKSSITGPSYSEIIDVIR